jgi:hypothetical protein
VIPWDALALLAVVLLGSWGAAAVRGAIHLSLLQLFLPVARYAYPAIIPTLLVLAFGWLECLCLLGKRQPAWLKPAVLLGTFAVLDVYAIWSIVHYFRTL